MTRQQKLNKLMAEGNLGTYDTAPYYPSTAPYMDDFGLGQNEVPAAAPAPNFQQFVPLLIIAGLVMWSQSR